MTKVTDHSLYWRNSSVIEWDYENSWMVNVIQSHVEEKEQVGIICQISWISNETLEDVATYFFMACDKKSILDVRMLGNQSQPAIQQYMSTSFMSLKSNWWMAYSTTQLVTTQFVPIFVCWLRYCILKYKFPLWLRQVYTIHEVRLENPPFI